MKTLHLDTETTGLCPKENGLVEVGCLLEIDGEIVDKLVLLINPYTYAKPMVVSEEALEINGKTVGDLESYPPSKTQFRKFKKFLNKHIDRYDKTDKLRVCGYNVRFDISFIEEWFLDNGDQWYGSYFSHKDLDVFALVKHFTALGLIDTEDEKLGTICEHFGVKLKKAHDAMSDIKATRKLYKLLVKKFIKVK